VRKKLARKCSGSKSFIRFCCEAFIGLAYHAR
jgi:hypothetical protein